MNKNHSISISDQIWNFVVHLRWHYQVFILSGGYLLGGFLQESLSWSSYLIQFFNVHLLLFGGATAYNSYWDKDEGPVGGLKNPPKMERWMWPASLTLQGIGLLIAFRAGLLFAGVYGMSMLLFWLYSTPLARWKSTPIRSLFAIGISTGMNSLLLGYLAASDAPIGIGVWVSAVGTALIILSLYPISQIYQIDEDMQRGDQTFAVRFGRQGVLRFYLVAFYTGLILISMVLAGEQLWLGTGFFVAGSITGFTVWRYFKEMSFTDKDYDRVMWIKYGTSMAFVFMLVTGIILKHGGVLE